ncbi:hypothetical protein [uncultured Draconibacterium sp.]|uniref:hypothetical protein n=1 Tax=uncultured Draconibacterium sp. TaxID=1573823 RepID=UPI002AA69C7E|nr:hypothetical protein [uncultured Draconibacterium sp.]
MKKIGLILIIATIILFSCEDKFVDSDVEGTIYGKVTAKDENSINVDSIQVLLINANYEPDTIICDNEVAIIDTVYSNSDGEFTFTNVEEGEYYVFPQKENYQLTGENVSIDEVIEISGNDLVELTYSARQVLKMAIFNFNFKVINIPGTTSAKAKAYRKVWYSFIPFWSECGSWTNDFHYSYDYQAGIMVDSGYTILFYTLTNAFRVELTINEITKTFYASIPIGNVPFAVYFEADWETEEVEQIFY